MKVGKIWSVVPLLSLALGLLLFGPIGCVVSGGVQVDCASAGHGWSCGASGIVRISPNIATFQGGTSPSSVSAYRLIFNVDPSWTVNTASPSQATVAATTDTGYTSSITVTLTPTTSTTAPVVSGDSVYTFNLPNTSAFETWAAAVAANTSSALTLTSSQTAVFTPSESGSFMVYIQTDTVQEGVATLGSARAVVSAGCHTSPCTE